MPLSQRQTQVLRLILLDGCTNREIANSLGITPGTVVVHRFRLMQVLDAHNVAELMRRAVELNLLSLRPGRSRLSVVR